MAEVASAFVSLVPSARGFGKQTESQVGGEIDSSSKKIGKRFGTGIKVGALAVVAGAGVAVKFLGGALDEAREAQKVGALTASTIKATGGAANVTAAQVGNLANAISKKTGIDDETIQSGQNMLLTFKDLRNETGKGNKIFNQASRTLVDMSAAMGTEPKQAAIQLGKALNDPIKGVGALSRVGVTFTEKQKATIKSLVASGNAMKAQKIILRELNSEFGGAAAAQATPADKARVAYGNLKETIGTALLPVMDKLSNVFTTKIAPAVTSFVTGIQKGTGAGGAFARIISGVGAVISTVAGFIGGQLVPFVRDLAARFSAAVGGTAGFKKSLSDLAPVGRLVMAVLRALWAGIQVAAKAAIPIMVASLKTLAKGLGFAARAAIALYNNGFRPAFVAITKGISVVIGFFGKMVGAIAKIPGPQQKAMQAVSRALDSASKHVAEFSGSIKRIPDAHKTKVTADTSSARGTITSFNSYLDNALRARQVRVTAAVGTRAVQARAAGGPINARQTYLVGEKGPELFSSRQAGRITPNNRLSVGSGGSALATGGGMSGPVTLVVGEHEMQAWFEDSFDGEMALR